MIRLTGASHHLLIFGEVAALDRFRGRWDGLVSVEDGTGAGLDAASAGACLTEAPRTVSSGSARRRPTPRA
jgi:hypothetical protein